MCQGLFDGMQSEPARETTHWLDPENNILDFCMVLAVDFLVFWK